MSISTNNIGTYLTRWKNKYDNIIQYFTTDKHNDVANSVMHFNSSQLHAITFGGNKTEDSVVKIIDSTDNDGSATESIFRVRANTNNTQNTYLTIGKPRTRDYTHNHFVSTDDVITAHRPLITHNGIYALGGGRV